MVLILNDVSGSEIFLILFFVLIFFGAKSIPGLARTLGRTMRQIKDASADLQREIRKSGDDMKKDLNLKGILEDTARDISQPLDQQMTDIENTVKYDRPRIHSHIPVPQEKQATEVQEGVEEPTSSLEPHVQPPVKEQNAPSLENPEDFKKS